jgi:hypothetical protein
MGVLLLEHCRTVFDHPKADRLPTEQLLLRLHDLPESPWRNMKGKRPRFIRRMASVIRSQQTRSKVLELPISPPGPERSRSELLPTRKMRGAGPDLSSAMPDKICIFMQTFIGSIGSVASTRRVPYSHLEISAPGKGRKHDAGRAWSGTVRKGTPERPSVAR